MKFCPSCGNTVTHRVPKGDNRNRYICDNCDEIHYQNPRIITGTLPLHEDRVLLCRRAIAPRKNFWTLPAGFLENGETSEQGAIRETMEEAKAEVNVHSLYTLYNLPHISQIYMFYRAELKDLNFSPGIESLEVRLFSESEIPWTELAFPVINNTLAHYFSDRKTQVYPTHVEDIIINR
ncbi:MAG: NUDIX hydrolase [Pseudomonadales bacterium]|nr:NUDIX hydrolase [Pseudomonadales bacterium]